MKKEAISTFNEGLNYDLNPITTPDNVLTDCVNGTFITFNGDELALQSSLGNKVLTQLSTGFHPVGMKEYGGVLYIVSAKPPADDPLLFNDADTYTKGRVVYTVISGENYYFESLENNNTATLPIGENTSSYWLYVGKEKDFINKYSEIEFGSFPSLVSSEATRSTPEITYAFNSASNPLNILYKPIVIVKDFGPSMYVTFTDLNTLIFNPENFSYSVYTYNSGSEEMIKNDALSIKRIYKVRLLQQLTNGFRDLTENAWQQLANFVHNTTDGNLNTLLPGEEITSWFTYPNFKYFASDNYKGNLLMILELEGYDEFSLLNINVGKLSEDETDKIPVTFKFNFVNNSYWNPVGCPKYVDICYSSTDIPNYDASTDRNIIVNSVPINTISDEQVAKIQIQDTFDGLILNFKLRLKFFFGDSCTYVTYSELPVQFSEKYVLEASKKISLPVVTYAVVPNPEDAICTNGDLLFTSFSVMDNSGDYMDIYYQPSNDNATRYKYVLKDSDIHSSIDPQYLLGTYEYMGTYPYPAINFQTADNASFYWRFSIELLKQSVRVDNSSTCE